MNQKLCVQPCHTPPTPQGSVELPKLVQRRMLPPRFPASPPLETHAGPSRAPLRRRQRLEPSQHPGAERGVEVEVHIHEGGAAQVAQQDRSSREGRGAELDGRDVAGGVRGREQRTERGGENLVRKSAASSL